MESNKEAKSKEFWTKHRHLAEYDDPFVSGRRSASGKMIFECQKCGRLTQGAEKECFTFAMMSKEELKQWFLQYRLIKK